MVGAGWASMVENVIDDDGCRCPQYADYHAESQHSSLVREMLFHEPPEPGHRV